MEKLTEIKATITLKLDVSVLSNKSKDFFQTWQGEMEIEDLIQNYINYGLFRHTERVDYYTVTSIEEVDNPNL